MTTELAPMKLQFVRHDDLWDKLITDMEGNYILEQRNIILFPEQINSEYFDEWEDQLKNIPQYNIVEVERFI